MLALGDGSHCHAKVLDWQTKLDMPRHTFFSEWHQDYAVTGVLQTAGVLQGGSGPHNTTKQGKPLVYLDLAANDAIQGSNTFWFDRCLGWQGVCVEPNPGYHPGITKQRTCSLDKSCVSDTDEEIDFVLQGPVGHISHPGRRLMRLRCTQLNKLLPKHSLKHIHYLSLECVSCGPRCRDAHPHDMTLACAALTFARCIAASKAQSSAR